MGILNQRRHKVGGGIAIEQGIAVDAHQQVPARGGGAGFQRYRFPLIFGQMNHPQQSVLFCQLIQHPGGIIGGAVVDGDHLNVAIALRQRGFDGLAGIFLLVKAGNQNGDQRITCQLRRRGLFTPRPVALQLKPKVEPAGYPQHRHKQRPKKDEIQYQLAGENGGYAQRQPENQA